MKSEIESQKIERIILDSSTVALIKTISDQINLELGDLVQVTQKCVGNFVIRKRSHALSAQEMSEFLSENYDIVKALKHATQEAIKAKQNGDNIDMSDVLKLIQTPGVKSEMPSKKTRGRKKKTDSLSAANEGQRVNLSAANAVIESVNGDLKFANQDTNLSTNRTSANPEST